MMRLTILRIVLTIALGGSVGGLRADEGATLELLLHYQTVVVGETIPFEVRVTNHSDRPVTVPKNGTDFGYAIVQPDGQPMGGIRASPKSLPTPDNYEQLQPGETKTWSRLDNGLQLDTGLFFTHVVSPG